MNKDKDPRIQALLDFSRKISLRHLFPTGCEEATILIEKNSFAFVLAAVLNRGMKAEVIWTILSPKTDRQFKSSLLCK